MRKIKKINLEGDFIKFIMQSSGLILFKAGNNKKHLKLLSISLKKTTKYLKNIKNF